MKENYLIIKSHLTYVYVLFVLIQKVPKKSRLLKIS